MFSVSSLYPLSIALHLVVVIALLLSFKLRQDRSTLLWIVGSLLYACGALLVITADSTGSLIRIALVNFLLIYNQFFYVYSVRSLLNKKAGAVSWHLLMSLVAGLAVCLLWKLDYVEWMPVLAGSVFAVVNAWAFLAMFSLADSTQTRFVKLLGLAGLIGCVIWVARICALPAVNFAFAPDQNTLNYWFVTLVFTQLMFRHICYIMMRFDLLANNRLASEIEQNTSLKHQIIDGLNTLALARDHGSAGQIERLQQYVPPIAAELREMNLHLDALNAHRLANLIDVIPLHDIGKMGLPDYVMQKNRILSDTDQEIMKAHVPIGESVISSVMRSSPGATELLNEALELISSHHETWDGLGYPRGLSGEAIPIGARILAVIDAYDSLTSISKDIGYWKYDQAIDEITSLSGIKYDPAVVEAFVRAEPKMRIIAERLKD